MGFKSFFCYNDRKKVIKKKVSDTFSQCQAFLQQYEKYLDVKQKKILKEYIKIKDYVKIKRMLKIIFGGYLKHGFIRKVAQIFYI